MPLSTGEQRRAVRKLNWLLLPCLCITYGIQFYDKAVLGSASVFGIIEDLNLSTTNAQGQVSTLRYSTATAAFYYGYLVAVLPVSLILQVVPLGKASAVVVLIWGIVVLLTIACNNFAGLTVQRVALGAIESTVSPAFVAISNSYFTKQEVASRIGIWYSATGLFSMISGVINFGLGSIDSSIASWKILFLFAGLFTIVWSFVIYWLIPDNIASARYFSKDEKEFLQERLVGQTQGASDKRLRRSHLLEALKDPLVYVYLVVGTLIYVCNGGVTAFGARIIRTFGYTSLQSILLQVPGGATTCISIYICCWLDGRFKNITTYLMAASCLPVMVGSIILWKGSWEHRALPLFGYYLIPIFGAPFVMLLTLASRNVAGGAKKAVVNGALFIGYCAGNIIGPYTVLTPEATSHYHTTWITLISAMSAVILLSFALRAYYVYENKRRDSIQAAQGISLHGQQENETDDKAPPTSSDNLNEDLCLSDRQDPHFRYSY